MYLSQFGSVRPIDLTTVSAEIVTHTITTYRGADKSLAQPASRCILFDG